MAIEKKWKAVSPISFAADGTSDGVVTLPSTYGLKVKQEVLLKSSSQPGILLEIKRVSSSTQLIVGPKGQSITTVADISAYLVSDSATLEAGEQARPGIPLQELQRAVYQEEPSVALRTLLVDLLGESYSTTNPLPVQLSDGSINIETLNANLAVQLSAKDNDPTAGDIHDSVRIGDGIREAAITNNDELKTNDIEANTKLLFSLLANSNFMKLINFDQIVPSWAGDTTTLSYYVSSNLVGEARLRFASSLDWDLALEAYINDDGAGVLLDDDNERLILD